MGICDYKANGSCTGDKNQVVFESPEEAKCNYEFVNTDQKSKNQKKSNENERKSASKLQFRRRNDNSFQGEANTHNRSWSIGLLSEDLFSRNSQNSSQYDNNDRELNDSLEVYKHNKKRKQKGETAPRFKNNLVGALKNLQNPRSTIVN